MRRYANLSKEKIIMNKKGIFGNKVMGVSFFCLYSQDGILTD